ncbi:hypothetical protein DITRI_Ditri17bG0079600 [Diplodiscus trichospermus]
MPHRYTNSKPPPLHHSPTATPSTSHRYTLNASLLHQLQPPPLHHSPTATPSTSHRYTITLTATPNASPLHQQTTTPTPNPLTAILNPSPLTSQFTRPFIALKHEPKRILHVNMVHGHPKHGPYYRLWQLQRLLGGLILVPMMGMVAIPPALPPSATHQGKEDIANNFAHGH